MLFPNEYQSALTIFNHKFSLYNNKIVKFLKVNYKNGFKRNTLLILLISQEKLLKLHRNKVNSQSNFSIDQRYRTFMRGLYKSCF